MSKEKKDKPKNNEGEEDNLKVEGSFMDGIKASVKDAKKKSKKKGQ